MVGAQAGTLQIVLYIGTARASQVQMVAIGTTEKMVKLSIGNNLIKKEQGNLLLCD